VWSSPGTGSRRSSRRCSPWNSTGCFSNRLRYRIGGSQRITPDVPAVIQAFAQQEMVSLFMEGVDPTMRRTLLSTLSGLMSDYPRLIQPELAAVGDRDG
jgi:hypothetical protein